MTTYQLLDLIRRRSAMYIGQCSTTHLRAFVEGYFFRDWQERQSDLLETPDFNGFNAWVADKFGYGELTVSWDTMISAQRVDEQEGLWLFFQLLDEYRELRPQVLARAIFDSKYALSPLPVNPSSRLTVKPYYNSLTIEEILPQREWVALIGKRDNNIVYFSGADTVSAAIELACKDFHILKY